MKRARIGSSNTPQRRDEPLFGRPQRKYEAVRSPTAPKRRCGTIYSGISLPLFQRIRTAAVAYIEARSETAVCDIARELNVTKKLKRGSVSNTVQFFARLHSVTARTIANRAGVTRANTEMVLKMAFRSLQSWDNSLAVERRLYKQVTNPLIFNRNTPHLIVYYGTLSCPRARAMLNNYGGRELRADLEDIRGTQDAPAYDLNTMYLMVLERSKGVPLDSLASKPHFNKESVWRPVLFQVLWTLICFKDVGLSHNDLHWGNVFVTILPQPVRRFYVYGRNRCFVVETNVFVQLFDLDRSAKVATQYDDCVVVNKRLQNDDCPSFGMCNRYSEKRDITRLLHYLITGGNEFVRSFIARLGIVNMKFVASLKPKTCGRDAEYTWPGCGTFVWDGMLCRTPPNDETPCKEVNPSNDKVSRLAYMLAKVGAPYERQCPPIDDICTADNVWVRPSLEASVGLKNCAT